VVSGFLAAGSILVTGLVVVPALTARLLARRVARQMVVSAVLGSVATWAGIYASYYLPIASGGAIVLVAGLFFAVVLGLTQGVSWVSRRLAGGVVAGDRTAVAQP